MERDLLIIGIDPGTTMGYAILDLNGQIKEVRSSKGMNLSSLIFNVVDKGKVIVVGTDVKKVPGFVKEFSQKTGAILVSPDEDLSVIEKKEITRDLVNNKHERDALASAFYAYKKMKKLFDKVDIVLRRENKEEYKDRVKELVLTEQRSCIIDAVRSL